VRSALLGFLRLHRLSYLARPAGIRPKNPSVPFKYKNAVQGRGNSRVLATARSRRRLGLICFVAVAAMVAYIPGATAAGLGGLNVHLGLQPPSAGALTQCTEAALIDAIGSGGTVDYGTNCTSVLFTKAIPIASSESVTINGDGYAVAFNGQEETQLFVVTGGSLTLEELTLENGQATGSTGSSGSSGIAGGTGAVGGVGTSGGPGVDGGPGVRERPVVTGRPERTAPRAPEPGAAPF
jgi:hypothetical protein